MNEINIHQGWKICAGRRQKYAQNMRNMRKKYAQNMRNPKNGVGSATPYLITHGLLQQNMMIFFYQEEVLIILSTLKAPF